MAHPYRTALFLFRRDLRLDDNSGLFEALSRSERVIPGFVFDPRQQPAANPTFSPPAFEFLIESLADLDRQLAEHGARLYRFRGLPHELIDRLAAEHGEALGLDAVFVNRDYTPFSTRRDREIEEACARRGLAFHSSHDLLLHEPGAVLTGGCDPYRVFTPFYRAAQRHEIAEPRKLLAASFFTGELPLAHGPELDTERLADAGGPREGLHLHGGRRRALEILGRLGDFRDYPRTRDLPAEDGTTSLSAHGKFGTVSVRETVAAIRRALGAGAEPLIRQLHWRDFFTQLAWFYPHVFGGAFQPAFDAVCWDGLEGSGGERFEAWCRGETGFPLVDAGMRQLAATGWMHNRARMVVASFLTKDLHLDWRLGERWFARHLVDYDPCVNNGNWQWAASTGADAQPWFRIFNPWSQQKKLDPEGVYIRRWVPELEGVEPRDLHRLDRHRPPGLGGYPQPIVDHAGEREETLARFEAVRRRDR